MKKNSMWLLRFNIVLLVFILVVVGINYLGKLFVGLLKLLFWLDLIGICFVVVLGGFIVGVICGVVNNIIYGLIMDLIFIVYVLISGFIGVVVGICVYKGVMKNIKGVIIIGIIVGFVVVVIFILLNMIFWGGIIGNVWGDVVYVWVIVNNILVFLVFGLDEVIVDLLDKIVILLVVFVIYKGFLKILIGFYKNDEEIESLD